MSGKQKIGISFLAFALPGLLLLFVYGVMGVYPFGERSLLITDMSQLYVDFYSYLLDVFHGQQNLFFSWEAGLGMNMTGVVSFYLSSPFSIFIVFFDKQSVTEGILLITLLKASACGLTFSLYARNCLKTDGLWNLCFSTSYGLMSYVMVYALNIMWLDGVIFLPLVLMGVHRLLEKGTMVWLTAAYTVLFLSQFYIGYMVGIFSLLYFAGLCVVRRWFSLSAAGKFLLCALTAGGLSTFLWLPTYLQLSYVYMPESPSFSTGEVTFFQLFEKTLFDSYDSLINGLPNLYCGMLTALFVPLYFINRRISLREKLTSGIITLLLCISTMVWELNLAWHAGDEPTWFPYRFSFLLSFCGLFMAMRAFQNRQVYSLKAYGVSVLFLLLLLCGVWLFRDSWVTEEGLVISALLIGLYALFMGVSRIRPRLKTAISVLMLVSVCVEMGMNGINLTQALDREFGYENRSVYTENYQTKKALQQQADELAESWYRMEDKSRRNANDALSAGYQGLAHYSSFTNRHMSDLLGKLGVSTRVQGRFLRYYGSSNIIDSLLGIRYVAGHKTPHAGYLPVGQQGEFTLYENPDALPIGFLAPNEIEELELSPEENVFEAQNRLMSSLVGAERNYFTPPSGVEMTPSQYAYPSRWFSDGWCHVSKLEGKDAYLEFSVVNNKDQEVYFYMTSSGFADNNYLFLNRELLQDEEYALTGAVDLGWFEKGETITVQMYLNGDLTYLQMPLFYGFDAEAFHQDCETLKAKGMTDMVQSQTEISGTVQVDSPQGEVLVTSIPADPGWTVLVDGQKVQPQTILDGFLTVALKKGSHRISFVYCPAGLKEGGAASIASAVLGILAWYWCRRRRKRAAGNLRLQC